MAESQKNATSIAFCCASLISLVALSSMVEAQVGRPSRQSNDLVVSQRTSVALKQYGAQSKQYEEALFQEALYCHRAKQTKQAIKLFEQAIAIAENQHRLNSPRMLDALAESYCQDNNAKQAKIVFDRALAIINKNPFAGDRSANLYLVKKLANGNTLVKYSDTLSLWELALKLADIPFGSAAAWRSMPGPSGSPGYNANSVKGEVEDLVECIGNVAYRYQRQGKLAEAEKQYKRGFELVKEWYPREMIGMQEVMLNNYASLLRQTNKQAEAEKVVSLLK